jgi:hypothetical protein
MLRRRRPLGLGRLELLLTLDRIAQLGSPSLPAEIPGIETGMASGRTELTFDGTDGAIVFARPDMAAAFRRVVHGWPATDAPRPAGPFAEVWPAGARWTIELLRPEPRQQRHDPVNGICDLIVELNWSRLRRRTDLMCLHAAGVEMGGSLVVFPSGRRAGKSTLTAELSRRGHRVFSDDVLAVDLDAAAVPRGLATGIAPRLRVPLPDDAPQAFRHWVAADAGPENRQYKYLTGAPVAAHGSSLPLGAIVTLDRVEGDVSPTVAQMDAGEVLPVLIHQNFGRFGHAGRTLAAFEAIARDLPCLRLTYGRFEEAADFLEARVAGGLLGSGAAARAADGTTPIFGGMVAPYDPARAYRRRPGFRSVDIDREAFVADADGIGIFRLGQGMLPIWRLLEEPLMAREIVAVLGVIFPNVGRDILTNDVDAALRQLNEAGLIEAVGQEDVLQASTKASAPPPPRKASTKRTG